MDTKTRIVLAVTNGSIRTSRLVVKSNDYQKFVTDMEKLLYEFNFVDIIDPDLVTMDIIRAEIASLMNENTPAYYEFTHIALVDCMRRRFETYGVCEPNVGLPISIDEFKENTIRLDIFDLKNSPLVKFELWHFDIKPDKYDSEKHDGWHLMSSERPEMFEHLHKGFHDDDENCLDPLVDMTQNVLVFSDGSYYIDARRKFKHHRTWIWTRLEGSEGEEWDKSTYWRELPPDPRTLQEVINTLQ